MKERIIFTKVTKPPQSADKNRSIGVRGRKKYFDYLLVKY